jgi:O-antigen/teichoic acid export membrane protein
LAGHYFLVTNPAIGYYGSAISAVACYAVMCILCYYKGRKVFKVPYDFKKPALYLTVALIFIYGSNLIVVNNNWLQYGIDLLVTFAFLGFLYLFEGRNFTYKTVNQKG